jgi:DNA mismatch repair protein MutL
MKQIKKLPQNLINQIAAGEVVERPASVVKELVENAIDAQADFIEVKIDQGGKSKIMIKDNGLGMDKENAQLAFDSHTTSKIDSLDDLTKISSYGFRGEALASIASVSKIELKTKNKSKNQATKIVLEGGGIKDVSTTAHPIGTTIIVEDLFYNVPARQKFLKTTRTEFNHIRDWLQAQALSLPKIGFLLDHNDREIFHYPENQELKQRLQSVLGDQVTDFIPIKAEKNYLKLHGLIAPPAKARKRRKNQFIFVNKRHVNNKTVIGAVKQGYGNILPSDLHPPFVLFLNIRPDLVDVNIHPRKEEIKFVSSSMVFSTVKQAIQSALGENLSDQAPSYSPPTRDKPISQSDQGKTRKQFNYSRFNQLKPDRVQQSQEYFSYLERDLTEKKVIPYLPQIGRLYLIVPQEDHLWIIDQHAAEERILLEQFINDYQKKRDQGMSQKLLFDLTLDLTDDDLSTLEEQQDYLNRLGFEFDFKENKVKVKAIPNILEGKEIETILLGFLDDLSEKEFVQPEEVKLNPKTFHTLATLACRSAVKQGDRLIMTKRKQIVKRLKELGDHGATCPHGRPTWLKLSMKDLAKMFKRE